MDSRKLIQFGKNSFVICVPKNWVNENKLVKGDSVYISDEENELKISPAEKKEQKGTKNIIINTDNKSLPQIRTEIVSAYLTNCNLIEIRGKDLAEEALTIKNVVRNLTGMEIMELSANKIIAHDLLNEEDVSIENITRRIDMSIRSMLIDSIKCVQNDKYESLFQRDEDVNRLVFLAYRVMRAALKEPRVAKSLGIKPIDVMTSWLVIMHLEQIGDQAKRIARHMREINIDKNAKTKLEKIYQAIEKDYLDSMKAYYQKDMETPYRVTTENTKKINMCNEFEKEQEDINALRIIEFLKVMISCVKHIARASIARRSD